MEQEHTVCIAETRTDNVGAEQSDISSDNCGYGNKCAFARKYLPCASSAACGQPEKSLLHEEVRDGNFEYRKPRCLSSYYSVFVARLAIMGMLAILIGLLTILTWHFTTVYTTKSIKSLAYGLRFELLQRPVSRMWNILNATVEINMAQVKLAEYVAGRFSPPLSPDRQVQLYEVMKDITWALFVSRKALDAVAVNYNNGHVQAFHRNRRNNSTFYIFSEPANATSPTASRKDNYKEGMSNAPVPSWSNVTRVDSNSSIWYMEPLDPVTGEKNGPRQEIPPDDLINISGISQLRDGDASWNVTVSKFTDSPLLSSTSPVRLPIEGHIVATVGVRTALSSVGQLMKELVDLHSGYMYLTSQEGYLLATSTSASLLRNTTYGPKLMMAVESSDPIIRAGAKWLQNKYGNGLPFNQEVHVENVMLQRQRFYIDSFSLNLKRLPLVGVIIIPRSYVMGKVDQRGHATLVILISASICILVIGCICILILTSGVSKEMKLRAELISHLDARRRAEASSSYKSQFLANMSHELRTPMAAIIGLLDILLCDEYLTTEQIGMVSQIRHCSTALLRLLNNILDLSKVESGKLVLEEADFDLGHELEGLVDMFSVQCVDHDIEIVLDLADDMPRLVRGDSARVLQIFANLISNSIKFTSSGHIILRSWCESSMVNQKTDIVSENDKDYWSSRKFSFGHSDRRTLLSQEQITLWFEVEDTGCGIDPSKWQSVFESFVQADLSTTRTYGGTGLGLCIVRSLVSKMGGHIKVIQKEGPGTLMRFYLVFGRPIENSNQFSEHLWKKFGKDQPMVLLALKGNIVRLIMSQWLKANGIQAYEASDWNEMTKTLSKAMECGHLQNMESTENVLLENAVNHWLPMNACGSEAFTKDSIHLNEERVFRIASENQLSKPLNLFVIVDTRLLDFGMNTWKDQLSHLNEYFGAVKFAWLLNHDISTNVKLELRRTGHSVMVNRPLYKSKLVQTLITMIGDTKIELEKLTESLHTNFQLNMQEGLNNESTGNQTREESSDCKLSKKNNYTSATEIQHEFTENTGASLCHTIQNISDSINYSRSLSSSFTTMKERIDFLPYPLKDLNSLIRSSEILTKSEDKTLQGERDGSSKKFKFDYMDNETDTNACYKSLQASTHPEFHSGNCNGDSFEHTDQSEILMINSMSKQHNGHLFNVQLVSEEKNGSFSQKLPLDISGSSSCLQMSSKAVFTVAGKDNLKSKDQLSSPPSQSPENGRSDYIKHPMMSDGSSNLPIQMTPSNGIQKEKSLEGIRILLAEDTPILQRVATTMLEKLGATVLVVGDGLQAVDALKSAYDLGNDGKWTSMDEQINIRKQVELPGSPPFDLVLMDCQMPRMDGYEATKMIRTAEEGTSYHIPIVALTAHAMSSDAAKCLEVGMDAYLTKPIDCKHMASTILSLTKKKR